MLVLKLKYVHDCSFSKLLQIYISAIYKGKDFKLTSKKLRSSKGYNCEECQIELSEHKKFCHTHHIDGDKSKDNAYSLKNLCIECYAQQSEHGWIKNSLDYKEFSRLRKNLSPSKLP